VKLVVHVTVLMSDHSNLFIYSRNKGSLSYSGQVTRTNSKRIQLKAITPVPSNLYQVPEFESLGVARRAAI